jgi:glycosyltransferase involved in cell wall biosynthesis
MQGEAMDIVFYTRGLPFDGGALEGALGGSESAVIHMARELAALGNRVRVFCNCPRPGHYPVASDDAVSEIESSTFAKATVDAERDPCFDLAQHPKPTEGRVPLPTSNGSNLNSHHNVIKDPGKQTVEYYDLAQFGEFAAREDCDVLIASRYVDALAAPVRTRLNILWNHDVLTERAAEAIQAVMYKNDALFCISQFQREQYLQMLGIPAERIVLTRNGVDLELIAQASAGVVRERNRLIYTSRPERGLRVLLEMWPQLKAVQPELRLGVAWYDNPGADAQMEKLISNFKFEISKLTDIELLGSLNKHELYREMARARVWVYPATFPEVSCISAMEAAACGTPAIASRYCALKETIADGENGVLIPGVPGSEEYAQKFAEAVVGLVGDKARWQQLSEAGRKRIAAQYQWREIVKEWSGYFEEKLGRRIWIKEKELSNKIIGGVHEPRPQLQASLSTSIDYREKQSVSCCMIAKNGEGTLHRCLKSVRPWVEELIVCDTGSEDSSREIARQYADVMRDIPWEEDFGAARNRALEGAKGDWILWIDADEYVVGGEQLGKYLRDNIYNGYVIRQHHQALDAQFRPDVPVRLFRNGRGIKFFGVIHEHPEQALNCGIQPAVVLSDVHIVHDGYITEEVRRARFLRNLPLLLKDREKYPERRLGLVFLARDYIHLARYEMEKTGGKLTARGRRFLERAMAIHRENFTDPREPLHAYSFPLYQTALALLDAGIEVAWQLAPGEIPEDKVHRWRFGDEGELRMMLEARMQELFRQPQGQFAFE